jgi:hypothetical protein
MRTSFQAMLDTFNHIPAEFIEECAPNYKSEDAVKRDFDDYLDNCEGPVTVAGQRFWPSEILKKLDPIAYGEEFRTYSDLNNQLWIDTPDGWLTADDVDNIVDAWEVLPDKEQNMYLGDDADNNNDEGGCDCDDCDCNDKEV